MARKKTRDIVPKVAKPNTIAEARGQIDQGFLDINDIILSKINMSDDEEKNLIYNIKVSDYRDKFGLVFDKNAYRKLKNGVKKQLNSGSLITIINKRGNEENFFPIQDVEWDESNGTVIVELSRKYKELIVEALSEHRGGIIYYALPFTLKMKSKYSKKLFPILLENIGRPPMMFEALGNLQGQTFAAIYPLEKLRDQYLCLPKSYKLSNIKAVCDTIVAEIMEYTEYEAEVFYNLARVSGSRKPAVTHVCWKIRKVKGSSDAADTKESATKADVEISEKADALIKWAAAKKLDLDQIAADRILKAAEENSLTDNQMHRRINKVLGKRESYDNLIGMIIFSMSPKYKDAEEEKEIEKEKKQREHREKHEISELYYDSASVLEIKVGRKLTDEEHGRLYAWCRSNVGAAKEDAIRKFAGEFTEFIVNSDAVFIENIDTDDNDDDQNVIQLSFDFLKDISDL